MKRKKKSNSTLKDITRLRGTQQEIATRAGISDRTLREYLKDPKKMDGHSRAKLAKALRIDPMSMDSIINGVISSAEQYFAMKGVDELGPEIQTAALDER